MPSLTRKLWKWTAGTFAVLVILLGLTVGVFRIVLEQVPDYRVQIEDWVSARSGLKLEFSDIDARWRLYGPELVFENAVVRTPDGGQALFNARQGSVAFDIWASLASGRLTTGRFSLEGPEVRLVRTAAGRIELVGQDELPERTRPFSLDTLPTGRFSISDARVIFRDLATGRGPWELAHVGLTLQRRSSAMRLEGTGELPSALGRKLEFTAGSRGTLDDPASLVWTFEVGGTELALAGLGDLMPDEWPAPTGGRGSFTFAGTLKGARVESLGGSLSLTELALPLPAWATPLPGPDPLVLRLPEGAAPTAAAQATPALPALRPPATSVKYDLVRATFEMHRDDVDGWQLGVEELQLVRPGLPWDPSRVEIAMKGSAQAFSVRGKAGYLAFDNVWPLLAYLPENATTARLRSMAATGRVNDASFAFERTDSGAAPAFAFAGRLDSVGFAPVLRTPGMGGLSGVVEATDQGGTFNAAGQDVTFTLPLLFREALAIDSVNGLFSWTRDPEAWRIATESVQLADTDGKASARLRLVVPHDRSQSPVLDVDATATDILANETARYLPAGRLTANSIAWFDRAFPGGTVTRAAVSYHGPTRSFPFRNGEGTFEVRADVEDITLDYASGFAPLTGVRGEVVFQNAGLVGRADSGQLHGLDVSAGTVRIADLRTAELDISGTAAGELAEALDYLKASKIGPVLGERFMALEGEGATRVDVRLWLPLKRLAARKVDVTAQLVDAEVGQVGVGQKVTALNGSLRVLDRALVSQGLEGRFLGGPVTIIMDAVPGAAGPASATQVQARGRASAVPLQELLRIPAFVDIAGATNWRMDARFDPAPGISSSGALPDTARDRRLAQSYIIESDLVGLDIAMPEPLSKPQVQARNLRAELELDGSNGLIVRGAVGDVRTVARFERKAGSWTFDRAGVRADGLAAAIPGHPGMRVEGDISRFVLDDWLALRRSGTAPSAGGQRLDDILKAANVRIASFRYLGYEWADVRGLLQATPAGWQVDVAGPDAEGELVIPYELSGRAPLTLTMERLAMASRIAAPRGGPASTPDPRQIPPIIARINDFSLGVRQLGNVRMQLDRVPRGLAITSFTAQGASFIADINGAWVAEEGPAPGSAAVSTTINGAITSTDVGATLQALGYGNVIAGQRGVLQAALSWQGGPDAEALARASGTVRVEIDDGQVLDLQPGAGRMLGLLSVAALPRRLALDFSDLTDKGLAFDSIRGDFELRQGNAYTNNLLLTGPAADIGIAGRTGLAAHDYDQTAVVTGNFGATLPVAGALAGGPVVGAAMLLFSQVFKEPLKGITRGYYRITGKWEEPQVERVVASDAKEAAAAQLPASAASPTPGSSN